MQERCVQSSQGKEALDCSAVEIPSRFHSDTYQLLEKIGEGGFGQVFKAKQITTGQYVAIKFLTLNIEFDGDKKRRYIDRFEREILLVSRLHHPNIVRLLDKGRVDTDLLYAVFEYVDGLTLKETLQEAGALSPTDTAEIMSQVLDALTHAHESGVIHRDLKPANIMLKKTGVKLHAKILDFGIGSLVNEARQNEYKTITLTQESLGTPSYSAPEQLRGEPPSAKTDLYVWGLVFLECLTGYPAITGSSLASIFHKQLSPSNVPFPPAIVGHPVAALLRRVLNKKTHDRIANAEDIYRELKKINFSTLVGGLQTASGDAYTAGEETQCSVEKTVSNGGSLGYTWLTEKKQISVLAVSISAKVIGNEAFDTEIINSLLRDQKNLCVDIAIRFGGFHVGTLADTMLFYFGYPAVTDSDSRLCARTALEISSNLNQRNAILKQTQSVEIIARIGMHTGLVVTYADSVPEGNAPNIAMELSRRALPRQVLCSGFCKKLLDNYIEFRASGIEAGAIYQSPLTVYEIVGERSEEAFAFLKARPSSSNCAFIGRDSEVTELLTLLKAAERPAFLHVYGDAGIGKSRLIFELRNNLAGFQGITVQCFPEQKNNALYPVLNILRQKYSLDSLTSSQVSDLLAEALQNANAKLRGTLTQALPILLFWLNVPLPEGVTPSVLAPGVQKNLLFDAIRALISFDVKKSGERSLYIFEDMHWSDPTSIEFISQLSAAMESTNDVFISTSRLPLPEPIIGGFHSLKLNKLTEESSAKLVAGLFEHQPVSAHLLDIIVSRADGVPLFIEELTNMIKAKSLAKKLNGVVDFVNKDKLDEVPNSLRDSLQQKLDSLIYSKETIQLAAVIGREFDYQLLVASSTCSEAKVQSDLVELVDAQIIYQQRKVTGDSYIFRHALVKDAAYESMTSEIKRGHSSAVFDAMLIVFPEYSTKPTILSKLATLSQGCEQFSRSVRYWLKAADLNMKMPPRQEEALGQYQKALSVMESHQLEKIMINEKLHIHSCLGLGYILKKGWNSEDVCVQFGLSQKIVEDNCIDNGLQVAMYKNKFMYDYANGNISKAISIGNKLKSIAEIESSPLYAMLAGECLCQAQFISGKYKAAVAEALRVNVITQEHRDLSSLSYGQDSELVCGSFMSFSKCFLREFEASEAQMDYTVTLAESRASPDIKSSMYGQKALLQLYLYFLRPKYRKQQLSTCIDIASKGSVLAKRNGYDFYQLFCDLNRYCALALQGEVIYIKEIDVHLDKMLGLPVHAPFYRLVQAQVLRNSGERKKGDVVAKRAYQDATEHQVLYCLPQIDGFIKDPGLSFVS